MSPRVSGLSIAMLVFIISGLLMLSFYVTISKSEKKLVVATTTSLYDTGLLDLIEKFYLGKYGVTLYFISAGTGQSLQYAKRGDADAVLVHAPSAELQFLQENAGVLRKIIAYNFFTIVGPSSDPATIKGLSVLEAMRRIAERGAKWISRGDNSGTYIKEISLWKSAGFDVAELNRTWYIESGTGMGATLIMANEKGAYTLTDLGTYMKYKRDKLIELEVLLGEGKELLNVYSIMAVNPKIDERVNFNGALDLIRFLISDEGQEIIGRFGIENFGEPLFYPAVQLLKTNSDVEIAAWIRELAFFDNSECPPQFRAGHEEFYGG